jgi:hypothetical protein
VSAKVVSDRIGHANVGFFRRPTRTSLVTTIAKPRSRRPRSSSATGETYPKKAPPRTMRLSNIHKWHENSPQISGCCSYW